MTPGGGKTWASGDSERSQIELIFGYFPPVLSFFREHLGIGRADVIEARRRSVPHSGNGGIV
jgi:hypothetical protein